MQTEMFPHLIQIGGFSLTSYGFMAALGALAAIFIFDSNRQHAALSETQATTIVVLGILSGLIGARIYYVIQFYDTVFRFRSFWKIFKIWEGGLVFYGGPLLALLVIFLYCRKHRLNFAAVLDICAPALAVAHALGRVGCFLNGCCVSTLHCTLPWGVTYPEMSEAGRVTGAVAVHPVQLYESCFDLVIAIPLFYIARKGRNGAATGCYMSLYGLWRFAIEFLRHEPKYGIFTSAQYISIAFFAAGTIFLLTAIFRKQNDSAETADNNEEC